jgi:hypothetical protein
MVVIGRRRGCDDDDKDVDVGRCSQFFDENIPSGDDLLIVEAMMDRSMANHLGVAKVIVDECQLGGQILCDHTMIILY